MHPHLHLPPHPSIAPGFSPGITPYSLPCHPGVPLPIPPLPGLPSATQHIPIPSPLAFMPITPMPMVSPLPTSIARFANVTPTVVASAPPRPATPPPPPPNYSLHPALKDFDKKTLVWVGRIDPGVDNELMKNVLMACGPFESWKRVADPTTGE